MKKEHWERFFVKLYEIISSNIENKDIENFEEMIKMFSDNENLRNIVYNVWKLHFNTADKDIQWWKRIFRILLEFATNNEKIEKQLEIGQEILDKEQSREMTMILLHILLQKQKEA